VKERIDVKGKQKTIARKKLKERETTTGERRYRNKIQKKF